MNNFVLVTRGRTGSTAVLDELGKASHISTTQELFLRGPYTETQLKDGYTLLPPFDLWKQQGSWWKRKLFPSYYNDRHQAHSYLTHAARLAQLRGAERFGWKVLSHNFDERPYLGELLRRLGYCVIYLRRNNVRQVLSGMMAIQRGVYNSKEKIVDTRRYHIDVDNFRWLVQWELECVKKDCAWLTAEGFDFIEVSYEDFCSDRQAFYSHIFCFLNLPREQLPPSDFVKMIKDLKMVIENYDEVVDAAAEFGEML